MIAVVVFALLAADEKRQRRPNVLIVSLDTVRADHCSTYGYERLTTPALDRVAQDGTVMLEAYAPMATTLPAHAAAFTGHYPRRYGIRKNGYVVSAQAYTLAEMMRRAGYQTAAVVSSFAIHEKFGLGQGFESYDDDFRDGDSQWDTWEGHDVGGDFDQDASVTTEKAITWLEARNRAQPFLLWVHYFDAHHPYIPREEYRGLFPLEPGAARLDQDVANYDREIRETDSAMGQLLESLSSLGLEDSTLVVIFGDHGEGLMQHGWLTHGLHIYEEAVRVPLVFRWPGVVRAGQRLSGPVSLLDIPATLADLAKLPKRLRIDGQGVSLSETLTRGDAPSHDRKLVFERRFYRSNTVGKFRISGDELGLRWGDWKYIEAKDEGSYQLFNLKDDPGEVSNRVREHPRIAQRMARELDRWLSVHDTAVKQRVGEQDTDALRALGYVE